jgi:hypothetical protein
MRLHRRTASKPCHGERRYASRALSAISKASSVLCRSFNAHASSRVFRRKPNLSEDALPVLRRSPRTCSCPNPRGLRRRLPCGIAHIENILRRGADRTCHADKHRVDTLVRGESRRSTRVALKIVISVQGLSEPLTCDGETIVVNRHGALISSSVPLRTELEITIQVVVTGMRAAVKVVHVDPEQLQVCGIALEKPENIWDLSLPPDDWYPNAHES